MTTEFGHLTLVGQEIYGRILRSGVKMSWPDSCIGRSMHQLHREAAEQHEKAAERHRLAAEIEGLDAEGCGDCAVEHSNRAYELALEVVDAEGNS